MNIKELKKRVDEAYEKYSACKSPVVVCGNALRFGEYVEDEEASELNNWAPDGHWEIGDTILLLPEKAERNWR